MTAPRCPNPVFKRKIITLKEYAAIHGRAYVSAKQKAERGGFKTAYKSAGIWLIDRSEPYINNLTGETVPRKGEPTT